MIVTGSARVWRTLCVRLCQACGDAGHVTVRVFLAGVEGNPMHADQSLGTTDEPDGGHHASTKGVSNAVLCIEVRVGTLMLLLSQGGSVGDVGDARAEQPARWQR